MKRTMLVTASNLREIAQILTGAGSIERMDHEGTITFELEAEDEFELGRRSVEIENELRCYDMTAMIVSATKQKER